MAAWMAKRKSWVIGLLAIAFGVLFFAAPSTRAAVTSFWARIRGSSVYEYDVIIYGGSFSGYSALRSIQKLDPSARVLVIVPQRELGEIGTAGAMNFWDLRGYDRGWIGGSFKELFDRFDRAYDPDEMAAHMAEMIAFDANIEVHYGVDLLSAKAKDGRITEVEFQGLNELPDGRVMFDSNDPPTQATAPVFIDASYNGRLLRLAGFTGVVGREAYAERRQQAVTLMFEIEGLDFWAAVRSGDFKSNVDKDGSRMLWGGDPSKHPKMWRFNDELRKVGRLKPLNLAEGAKDRFWVNVVLLFGVDATKEERDRGTSRLPESDLMSVDEGYAEARKIVLGDEMLEALREFPGFENVHITRVAPMLYVRESVHSSLYDRPANYGFAVLGEDVGKAGAGPSQGKDARFFEKRIGLQFYFLDTQGYMERDPFEVEMETEIKDPASNPCYLPYGALLNPKLKNLLVCGYGLNVSSIAWYALRVLPNQMVAGDAAGAAAVYSFDAKKPPGDFGIEEIKAVQARLRTLGVVLDKQPFPEKGPDELKFDFPL